MPLYDYECNACGCEVHDSYESMHDDRRTECPSCERNTLEVVFNVAPHVTVVGEANTIGQLADRNSKKMGKTKIQELTAEREKHKDPAKKEKMELRKKINKMTPKQKQDYIHDGKI